MNDFCINLHFPDIPLFKEQQFLSILKTKNHHRIDPNDLHPAMHLEFNKLGLEIVFVESFFKTPFQENRIHKDAPGYTDATKINWVFDGMGSTMNWYEPKNDKVLPLQDITSIGVQYSYYQRPDLNLLHSQQVLSPSIVQVGIPHDITMGPDYRHCISAFFKIQNTNEYITFNESKDLFKDYIIDNFIGAIAH